MRYTPELTAEILELKAQGIPLEDIALACEVSYRSLISKLSSIGQYHKAPYTNKRGDLPKKKEELLNELAEIIGVDTERIQSLEKANKAVLELLILKLNG